LIQCPEGVSVDFGTINGHIYEIAFISNWDGNDKPPDTKEVRKVVLDAVGTLSSNSGSGKLIQHRIDLEDYPREVAQHLPNLIDTAAFLVGNPPLDEMTPALLGS